MASGFVIQRLFEEHDVTDPKWAVGYFDDTDDFVVVGPLFKHLWEARAEVHYLNGGLKTEDTNDIKRSLWQISNALEAIRTQLNQR